MCLDLFSIAIMEYLRLCKGKTFILAYTFVYWEVEEDWAAACSKDLVLHGRKPEEPVGTWHKKQNNVCLWDLEELC